MRAGEQELDRRCADHAHDRALDRREQLDRAPPPPPRAARPARHDELRLPSKAKRAYAEYAAAHENNENNGVDPATAIDRGRVAPPAEKRPRA